MDDRLPASDIVLRASNVEQTAIAEAVLSVAVEIAFESMGLRPDLLPVNQPPLTTDHRPLTTDHF